MYRVFATALVAFSLCVSSGSASAQTGFYGGVVLSAGDRTGGIAAQDMGLGVPSDPVADPWADYWDTAPTQDVTPSNIADVGGNATGLAGLMLGYQLIFGSTFVALEVHALSAGSADATGPFTLTSVSEVRGVFGWHLDGGWSVFGSLGAVQAEAVGGFNRRDGGEMTSRHDGGSAGLGVAYELRPGVSLRTEYIYTDLGSVLGSGVGVTRASDWPEDTPGNIERSGTVEATFSRVQVGLVFSF